MKRKLALLLAAVMVAAMVPVTAFAESTNRITNTVAVAEDTYLVDDVTAPELVISLKDNMAIGQEFDLVLEGAEWHLPTTGDSTSAADTTGYTLPYAGLYWKTLQIADGLVGNLVNLNMDGKLAFSRYAKNAITVTAVNNIAAGTDVIKLPMAVKVTGEEAKVTVVPRNSVVTAGTYTFAYTSGSKATVASLGSVSIPERGTATLEPVIFTETINKAFDLNEVIKIRLYGDFEFVNYAAAETVTGVNGLTFVKDTTNSTKDVLLYKVTAQSDAQGIAYDRVTLANIQVTAKKAADAGDVAEIVVSSDKDTLDKTTLEVASVITYGVTFKAADKKVPVFYAGSYNDVDDTLEVTFKEVVKDSWWANRLTTIIFPEGVKVISANVVSEKKCDITPVIDGNVVEITTTGYTAKAEWKMDFNLSVSPDFVGEITATVGGPALSEDLTAVVAEAVYPVTFEVECADVSIDYRNVAVGDITVIEAYAGALAKNDELTFKVSKIDLEGTAKVVVEGDAKAEITEDADNGTLTVKVTKESYKAPATIKITGVEAYLDRSLPAGDYKLTVTSANTAGTANGAGLINNYATKDQIDAATAKGQPGWAMFNKDGYTLAKDYIKVVTAGRDQDDSTFTTSVAVTIGANTMTVGKAVVALDVPAYIANGYTMLPVRAVADALSGDAATVLWDGATQTVTIAFGARIIGMTIGSKVMNINGVAVAMSAAPEITNGRTFLPVRDLGYALGLTDADIAWDDATKTATLN